MKRDRTFSTAGWLPFGPMGLVSLILGAVIWSAPVLSASQQSIHHLYLDGVINPIKVRYIENSIDRAIKDNAALVIISINTPGGIVESMQKIVTKIVNSPIPVVTFVEPQAAMATSAGTFIVIAGDVAAMVPGTTIGSAHPVGGQGEAIEGPMEEKVVNLLISLARSLAERRNRNVLFAEESIKSSMNLSAEDALETGVIDLLANNVYDLVEKLDGFVIFHENRHDTLAVAGLPIVDYPLSAVENFLDAVANPSIAYILMSLGVMGLIYEFASPGIGLGAVVGSISLLLGLVALSALPIHLGGLLLLVLGFIMLGLEFQLPSHGLLTVGGVIAIVLGSFMLIDASEYYGAVQQVKYGIVLPVVVGLGLFGGLCVQMAVKALRSPQEVGLDSLVGMTAEVREALLPRGSVFVDGALWEAKILEGSADKGDRVKVVNVVGRPRHLEVKKIGDQ